MPVIEKVKEKLGSRKARVFLIFLAGSFLAWFLSKLSESYEGRSEFKIQYVNTPDTLVLSKESDYTIRAKLRANGFRFFSNDFGTKTLKVDISKVRKNGNSFFLRASDIKPQIENQLSKSVSLIELDSDIYIVNVFEVIEKEVSLQPNVELSFEQNYVLDGLLQIQPDRILLKGPRAEIDTIQKLQTSPLVLSELSDGFSERVKVIKPKSLQNSSLSNKEITVSGNVVRFSEKEFEVTVEVLNLPEGYKAKVTPEKVLVRCQAKVERLKSLDVNDFELSADYKTVANTENKLIDISIKKQPDDLLSVRLFQTQVEFILEKQ